MTSIVRKIALLIALAIGALSSSWPSTARAETIVRAKELTANRLRARIVYVKELKAAAGRVGQVVIVDDNRWDADGRGAAVMRARSLTVDTIYAREIRADLIDADVVFAHEATVGPTHYGK